MAKTPATKTTRKKSSLKAQPRPALVSISGDEIARRAFEFYAARGGAHGQDVADWLQAERELQGSGEEASG